MGITYLVINRLVKEFSMNSKDEVLNEILRDIGRNERLGLKSLSCDDISPWGLDEVSKHITTELDKLGYRLYAFHYEEDGEIIDEKCGLEVNWE